MFVGYLDGGVFWVFVVDLFVFVLFFFFFFFQAEDGIRDGRVTGVQTCALPISKGRGLLRGLRGKLDSRITVSPARRSRHGGPWPSRHPSRPAWRRSSPWRADRKSTVNSSHPSISYAVFCLKKKRLRKRRTIRSA